MIFDVDGTLLDSVDLHAQAWQDAFAEFGHAIAFADIRGQIGKGGDQLMPAFLDPKELDRIGSALSDRRDAIFDSRYMERVTAFADVRPLFQRLLDDGLRIALASSASQSQLQEYKHRANVADLLDAETTSDDVESSKPEPDIFQAALQRLDGIAPADALVIGDTPYDAQAAGKAGIRCIGLLCGGWPDDALRAAGCTAIYRDPAELLRAYPKWV